jgi:hypothetical protein
VEIVVRPANDRFEHAAALAGDTFNFDGSTAFSTMETGEPFHPSGHDSSTVWYRWTAPGSGIARLACPSGDFAVSIFRGESVNALTLVAANPEQDSLFGGDPNPLHSVVHFAFENGATYRIQVSHRRWGPMPLAPSAPCDPRPISGYPFALQLQSNSSRLGSLDLVFAPGLAPISEDSVLCLFAAAANADFIVEVTADLLDWDQAASGRASGGTEVVRVPANFLEGSKFFRVRLP